MHISSTPTSLLTFSSQNKSSQKNVSPLVTFGHSSRDSVHFSSTALAERHTALTPTSELKLIQNVADAPSPLPPADAVLVLAHPDDESAFFAGLIIKLLQQGKTLQLIYATDGASGTNSDTIGNLKETRRRELNNALEILGVDRPALMLNYPDNQLRDFAIAEKLRNSLTKLIREIAPKTVYTFGPEGVTYHRDHIRTGEMTLDAVRNVNNDPDRERPDSKIDLLQLSLSDKSKAAFEKALLNISRYWYAGRTAETFSAQGNEDKIKLSLQAHQSQFDPKTVNGFDKYIHQNPNLEFIRPRVNSAVTFQ